MGYENIESDVEYGETTPDKGDSLRLYSEAEKAKQIKKEITRLRRLFKVLPKERLQAAEGLLQEVAFMRVTLTEARYVIDREGVIEVFIQGKQRFLREHPATKVYNTMVNRYTAACKQLIDMVPSDVGASREDELMAFVNKQRR